MTEPRRTAGQDAWTSNIDPKLFTVESLLHIFLSDSFGNVDAWRKFAVIEQQDANYSGCHGGDPAREPRPGWVVRFGKSYLRYSCGPAGDLVWDCYGDDFLSPALAFKRLLDAPVPPHICRPWPPNPLAHAKDPST